MMNKSSTQPSLFYSYGFDLQHDFSQFLEEAKEHEQESNLKSSSMYPEEGSKKTGSKKDTECKKSWKSSLISWWKFDNKNKVKSNVFEKRQGYVSGPIHKSNKVNVVKHKHPFSQPLMTSLFKPTMREEIEMPYMTLHQQNSPQPLQNYGPLYVVT